MKRVEFIFINDGRIMLVFSFYDFYVEFFKLLLLEDKFLLKLFILEEWLLFLKEVGLVYDVFLCYFYRFVI